MGPETGKRPDVTRQTDVRCAVAAGGVPGAPLRRVVVVSAAMGGGHLQVSHELARRLRERGHTAEVLDLLTVMPALAARALRWVYPWMVNRVPWLYDLVYRTFFTAPQRQGERASVPVRLALPGLARALRRARPDLVVSTYHLATLAVGRLKAADRLRVPAISFVTTFGVHSLWLHPAIDGYLAISPGVAARLRARTDAPVWVVEPVVRPGFARPGRRRGPGRPPTGTGPAERVAVVATGSLGLGRVEEVTRLLAAQPGWRPVVVAGRNDALRARLAEVPGAQVLGWVDDMAGLLARADVLIDNAAGSTAKEALASGVPVLSYRPIPGHGRDDAEMMARCGVAEVVDDAGALLASLGRIGGRAAAERVQAGLALFGTDPADILEQVLGVHGGTVAAEAS